MASRGAGDSVKTRCPGARCGSRTDSALGVLPGSAAGRNRHQPHKHNALGEAPGSSLLGISGPSLCASPSADFNLYLSASGNPNCEYNVFAEFWESLCSKLCTLRVVLGTLKLQLAVTSEGGLGDLPSLVILLFSLLKTGQSSG